MNAEEVEEAAKRGHRITGVAFDAEWARANHRRGGAEAINLDENQGPSRGRFGSGDGKDRAGCRLTSQDKPHKLLTSFSLWLAKGRGGVLCGPSFFRGYGQTVQKLLNRDEATGFRAEKVKY